MYLNSDIRDITDYNYVLDIIDLFSKWYYGYLLKTKEAEEVLKKLRYIWKILENVKNYKLTMELNLKTKYLKNIVMRII